MTISMHHIYSVIKAYSKQNRMKMMDGLPQEMEKDRQYIDLVSLSTKDAVRTDIVKKISHSLLDVILKDGDK